MSFSSYTTKTVQEVLAECATSLDGGLSSDEAAKRVLQYGKNCIAHDSVTWRHLLVRQCRSSFIYLLIVAAFLSFVLGQGIDAILISAFICINIGLGFLQEFRSHKALQALSTFIIPLTTVRRDGVLSQIQTTLVVPGDCVILEPGAMIPADIRFVKECDLWIDESPLTGESVSIKKQTTNLLEPAREMFEAKNIGFAGTSVVRGSGEGVVIGTGMLSALGSIAKATLAVPHTTTFEREIGSFSRFIFRLILISLLFLFLANVWIKGGEASLTELVIFSIALAVSVIPEALPLVVTFSLSRGAHDLARKKVVVKRLSAIEDLGGIDVLCTDKTGTLTENMLTVAHVLPYRDADTVLYACAGIPHVAEHVVKREPFDTALWNALSAEKRTTVMKYKKIDEVLFDPLRRRNTIAFELGRSGLLVSRGAYEDIIALCSRVPKKDRTLFEQWITDEGREGRRVLAIAIKTFPRRGRLDPAIDEHTLRFAGLISFVDPLKKTTKDAILKSRDLGVQVKILTGDSPAVAGAVARAIGLVTSQDAVLTGKEFDALSNEAQKKAVEEFAVFARISPDAKLRIIELLRQSHSVGFLGEGINDAPALKAADVAIVVQGGADIAREASDIVLLKKSLSVIIDGIAEGRMVFANTHKYIRATLASNFGNFYAVAVASLFIPYLPMLPLQILLVNLLSDFPMIAIATDSVDAAEVRTPRHYHVHDMVLIATILGLVSTVFDFIFFGIFRQSNPAILQTNWFMGSVLTELVFLFSIRTRFFFLKAKPPSVSLVFFTVLGILTTLFLPYSQIGQTLFLFTPPSPANLIIILSIVGTYFAVSETVKLMYYRHFNHR